MTRRASATPIRVGEYQILSGDFHVHAFVGDGGIAPWMLQQQAARVGLDVIAVTNHNQTLAGRLGHTVSLRSSGAMVIVGEEITGRNFHLIAVGIEHAVNWDQPARTAIEQVHAQGGVAIAAHPMRGFSEGYDEQSLAMLDGLEAAHPDFPRPERGQQIDDFYERALAHNPGVAAIGSSDFHMEGPLGDCRTYLLVRERSEAGVLEAIRDGRTVGDCARGALRGTPELVQLVRPYRDMLGSPREDPITLGATFLVWGSLLALAILGPRS
jgi:predicted metal-dependent phosphoesterase TrpH